MEIVTKSIKPIFLTTMMACFWAFQVSATTYHVLPTGDDMADGTTWATAFMTLQKALTVANSTDQIWVAAGTYKPTTTTDRNISFVMANGVTIFGGFEGNEPPGYDLNLRDFAANASILSGDIGVAGNTDNSYTVVNCSGTDNTAILDGFTITQGNANGGGGFLDPTRCGGGMYSNGGSAIVRNCAFIENVSEYSGGGMYNVFSSAPLVINCLFAGNTSNEGGGMTNFAASSSNLINCVFIGNQALSKGGGMFNFNASDPILTNCSFSGDTANQGAAIFNGLNADVQLINGIIWGNGASAIVNENGASMNAANSILEGGYAPCVSCPSGNGDINPLFVFQPPIGPGVLGDLRLQMGSPALDAADTSAAPGYDYYGRPRPFGVGYDIGAFEFGIPCPTGNILYVKANSFFNNNGHSWADAFPDLQSALTSSCPDITEIWVAAGTYTPTATTDRNISFVMKDSVAILGGFPNMGNPNLGDRDPVAHVTTLSGVIGPPGTAFNSYNVIRNDNTGLDSTAILDGFTISGGFAYPVAFGGAGMYNAYSSPKVTNCTFSGNLTFAQDGGGMYNTFSSPTVSNCIFSDNKVFSGNGGGMYNNSSSPTITNCTFSRDTAEFGLLAFGGGGDGGGMCNVGGSPTVNNCTFSENYAIGSGSLDLFATGAGMYNSNSYPMLTNCSFSGNVTFQGGGIYNAGGSPTVTGCIFTGNYAGFSGGGMYNDNSTSTVTNCSFLGNTAGDGSGMYNKSSFATVTNCSFSGNLHGTGNFDGGCLYNSSSSPTLTSCIFWGNGADSVNGPEIFDDSSTPNVTYSIVNGGYAGTGNLDLDPLFVSQPPIGFGSSGDLQLRPCSPAVDAGDNTALPPGVTTDLDGNTRILNATGIPTATIDMGAYEMQTDITLPTNWTGLGDGLLWSDPLNWSDGFIPQKCRDIIIPTGAVTVPAGYTAEGKTLDVLSGAKLTTEPSATMDIEND